MIFDAHFFMCSIMEDFDNKLEKYFPLQFVMLGYLLAIFGLYLLIDSFNLFGIVLIIPALIFSFSKTNRKNVGIFEQIFISFSSQLTLFNTFAIL